MNGYELHIQGTDGIWRQADLGEEAPAMNYQSNDIAELKDRQASYSQNLKLPQSKRNIEIFEAVNIAGIKSEIPYRRLYCRLYFGVNTIAGEGSFLVLLKISDTFECQILSGNAGFFENLKNKLMSDLDLPLIRLTGSSLHPGTFSEYHLFCLASFAFRKSGTNCYAVDSTRAGAGKLLPFVKILPVLNLILREEGYTMESNIRDEPELKNGIMPALFPKDNKTDFEFLRGEAKITNTTGSAKTGLYFTIISDASGFFRQTDGNGILYTAPADGTVTLGIHVRKNTTNAWIDISAFDKSGNYLYNYTNKGEVNFDSVEVNLYAEETIKINASARNSIDDISMADISVDILFTLQDNTDTPFYGAQIPLSGFGFNTRLDFVKAIVQAFGLFAFADPKNKIFRACTASFFYTQITNGNTLDWSNKELREKSEHKFSIENYGQKNHIRFADDETYKKSAEIVIGIDNNTLDPEKELFSLPFEAGTDALIDVSHSEKIEVACMPVIEMEDGKVSIKAAKPHLCRISDSTRNMELDYGYFDDYYLARHIDAGELKNKFYGNLEAGILKESLFVEEELLLDPQDIQDFDPFVPVYLEKHGYYFYVNKIKNFVAGKPTKVELIKL
jgi:hypothetical protein